MAECPTVVCLVQVGDSSIPAPSVSVSLVSHPLLSFHGYKTISKILKGPFCPLTVSIRPVTFPSFLPFEPGYPTFGGRTLWRTLVFMGP